MEKILSIEEYSELTQAERIILHLKEGYELDDTDAMYFKKVNMAFKVIHGEEADDAVRTKINILFPDLSTKEKGQLISDVTMVYGDFFTINQDAMRIIQEMRHERVYEAALAAGDYSSAERAANAIDKLVKDAALSQGAPLSRKLRKIRRTSDPSALNNLKDL